MFTQIYQAIIATLCVTRNRCGSTGCSASPAYLSLNQIHGKHMKRQKTATRTTKRELTAFLFDSLACFAAGVVYAAGIVPIHLFQAFRIRKWGRLIFIRQFGNSHDCFK
jgi:hypothetical protein